MAASTGGRLTSPTVTVIVSKSLWPNASVTRMVTLSVAGLAIAQSKDTAKQPHGADHTTAAMKPQPSDAASTKTFKKVHMKMMREMTVPYTGNSDVDFVRGMIPHHQGAISMARVELKYGKGPENRKLAEAIIKAQEKDVMEMLAWARKALKIGYGFPAPGGGNYADPVQGLEYALARSSGQGAEIV